MTKKDNESPNMRTKSWGPPTWFALTCFLMGYPKNNPTPKQKSTYKKFITLVGDVLPCNLCRDSYKKFIKELPLTPKILSSRKNLVMWFFKIHNKVNKKLGCKQLSQKQMLNKLKFYDKFRASKCSKDLGGCLRSSKKIKIPKRTKVVTYVDKQALRLKLKDTKISKISKKSKKN